MTVDCSGATPGAFTSINAAISSLTAPPGVTDWNYVLLRSNCTENVVVTGGRRLWIAPEGAECPFSGCPVGPRYTITSAVAGQDVVQISGPVDVTLVRLTITGGRNGIAAVDNANVTTYDVASDDNSSVGYSFNEGSTLSMNESSARRNGWSGVVVGGGSRATVSGQLTFLRNQPAEFSGNRIGFFVDRSVLGGFTGIVVEGNTGWGLVSYGGNLQWGAYTGETTVRNNGNGIFLSEGSQASLWRSGTGITTVRNNGSYGVYIEKGSQAFVAANVVEGHGIVGIDTVMGSQLSTRGSEIRGNGAGASGVGGVRVDGNSQAYLNQSQIVANQGPGVVVDFNSSVDIVSTTVTTNSAEGLRIRHRSLAGHGAASSLAGNAGAAVSCDVTSEVVSATLPRNLACFNVTRPTQPRPVRPPDP